MQWGFPSGAIVKFLSPIMERPKPIPPDYKRIIVVLYPKNYLNELALPNVPVLSFPYAENRYHAVKQVCQLCSQGYRVEIW